MPPARPQFQTRLAETDADLRAAQRLRYEVFVAELGGGGTGVDHDQRLETDAFDPVYDHLLLEDTTRDAHPVVGVYRLMPGTRVAEIGAFYTEGEYDITPLRDGGRPLLELGRSCLHRDYRGGTALAEMWSALARYVLEREIEVLFGVASFHGTDVGRLAQPLSHLHDRHLAPPELRVTARTEHARAMDILPPTQIDRVAAVKAIPALIKGYLRLGGYVGEGAFVDHAFNTTDVCLVVDVHRMSEKHRGFYTRGLSA
ncbi:GNAT family N-acetyltransferase [Tropicimonas sp. S265A]|uniref:GNAT family N-acetyltransferase n=1 Tax=Tropicimonas sp. S265A TaxID=3415134 RepID=UPI003C7A48E8